MANMRGSKLMIKFSEKIKSFNNNNNRQHNDRQQSSFDGPSPGTSSVSNNNNSKQRRRSSRAGGSLLIAPPPMPPPSLSQTTPNTRLIDSCSSSEKENFCDRAAREKFCCLGAGEAEPTTTTRRREQQQQEQQDNKMNSEMTKCSRSQTRSKMDKQEMDQHRGRGRCHNVMQELQVPSSSNKTKRGICQRVDLFENNGDSPSGPPTKTRNKMSEEQQRERSRRKVAISNFIMILFGLITAFSFIGLMSCSFAELKLDGVAPASNKNTKDDNLTRQLLADRANQTMSSAKLDKTTTTTVATTRLFPLDESSERKTTTTTTATTAGETDAESEEPSTTKSEDSTATTPTAAALAATTTTAGNDSANESENSAESSDDTEEFDEPAVGNRTKLGELILDAASSGADLLVDHLTPKKEAVEEEQAGGLQEGDDSTAAEATPTASELTTSNNNNNELQNSTSVNEQLKFALDTYEKWRSTSDDLIELFSRKLMPIIIEHGYDVDTTTVTGLLQVFNGIRAIKPWALKLLDASAKLTPGLLIGTQSDFGDFDECMNIRVDDPSGLAAANSDFPVEIDPRTGLKSTTLVGRYCLADVEFPKPPRIPAPNAADSSLNGGFLPIELRKPLLNFSETAAFKDTIFVETANFFHMLYVDPIRVGVCLTNKIDPDSFQQVFNKLIEEFHVTVNFRGRCVTKYDQQEPWSIYQLVSAYLLLVVCGLVVVSTLIELLYKKWNKLAVTFGRDSLRKPSSSSSRTRQFFVKYRPVLTSFSAIKNTKRLFKAPQLRATTILQLQQDHPQQPAADQQYKMNLIQMLALQQQQHRVAAPPATDSSIATDSSVESSPSIERRSSSMDAGSAVHLIGGSGANSTTTPTSSLFNYGMSSSSSCNNNNKIVLPQQQVNENYSYAAQQAAATSTGLDSINLLNLHGIRVLTMTWMIINHTYLFGGYFVLWAHRRMIDISEWPKSLSFQLVLNGWLMVEIYFFLSALIIVLNLMPLMRRKRFNYLTYIVHRLIRLMPAYVGLVCLNFLWPRISSGPVWLVKGKSFIQTPCENYLWTNFLFINNWIWPEKQCMVHTWFLSADFQLYLLAPIIVYLLYRRPALGHFTNLIVAIIASIFSGFVIYANELLPATLINKLEFDSIKQQLSYSYFATYQHVGPYCLGILTGYMLYKRPNIRLPKHLTWLLWILLPPLSFTTLLLTYLWNGAYNDPDLLNPSPIVSAVYVAIHRTIWTALIAWIVFACSTGRAKLLSNFLSHSIFIPFSRLSFSIYLVHLPVIMFRALNLRHTIEWTDSNILWEACGNFVFSLIMAYFLNVAFESPIINLENFIFGRDKATSSGGDNYKRQHLGAQTLAAHNSVDKQRGATATSGGRKLSSSQQQQQQQPCLLFTDDRSSKGSLSKDKLSSSLERTIQQRQQQQQHSLLTDENRSTSDGSSTDERRGHHASNDRFDTMNEQQQPPHIGHQQAARTSQTGSMMRPAGNKDDLLMSSSQVLNPALANDHHQQAFKKNWADVGSKIGGSNNSRYNILDDEQLTSGKNLTTNELIEQRRLRNLRLLAMNERPSHQYQLRRGTRPDDVYNILGEYQHYAPGSYQRWRMTTNNGLSSSRPKQYATLARTDRLDSSLPSNREQFEHLSRPIRQQRLLLRQAERHDLYDRDNQQQQQHHNHHPLPTSARATTSQEEPTRRPVYVPMARRQGRYNTLTGTGTGDWRLQYDDAGDEGDHYSRSRPWQRTVLDQPLQNGWQQQPAMMSIPRIDSSTLRRQARRNNQEATESSIVEEPADEESSDL